MLNFQVTVVCKIFIALFFFFFSFNAFSMNLTELIEGLFITDASVKSSESAVKEARNDVKTAWAAYLPDFDVKVEAGKEQQWKPLDADNTNYQFNEMDITFKQKIWDFGETNSDIRQKKNALDVAQLDFHAAKATLIIDAVDAYLGYIDAVKKLDSENETLQSKIESTGQEESRVKKGSGMASDVLQAKSDLAGAQKAQITAEGDLRKARNKFIKIFKIEPPESIDTMQLIELSAEGKSQLPKSLDEAIQAALERNVDFITKKIDLKDAEQDLVSARSDFLPTLDFESTYKYKYNVGAAAGAKEEVLGKLTLKLPLQPWKDLPGYKNKKYALLTAESDLEEEEYATRQTVGDLWEDYQIAQVTRDFAANKIVISVELLTIKKRERQLDQADAAAVTAAENAVNDDTQTLIDDETSLTESSLDLLESIGALTLASLQDQISTPDESSKETASTEAATEVTTEAATETDSGDEGPPPEAAPVEDVVTTEATTETTTESEQETSSSESETTETTQEESSESESDATVSTGCASNTYIGQQQADGSWKTVCKK
jgi:adhesin transport system outer membrane protein